MSKRLRKTKALWIIIVLIGLLLAGGIYYFISGSAVSADSFLMNSVIKNSLNETDSVKKDSLNKNDLIDDLMDTGVSASVAADNLAPSAGDTVQYTITIKHNSISTSSSVASARKANGIYNVEFQTGVVDDLASKPRSSSFFAKNYPNSVSWKIKYFRPGATSTMTMPITVDKSWAGKSVIGKVKVKYGRGYLAEGEATIKVAGATTDTNEKK